MGVTADVAVEADVVRLVAAAEELGPVGIVVNNAAAVGPTAPVYEMSSQDFVDVFGTNLPGPFLVARHALPAMIGRRRGSVVNIGSIAGWRATRCAPRTAPPSRG